MQKQKYSHFEKTFLNENLMGPNYIRILDELIQKLQLHSKMRILDLGCGTGLTSIYLAKTYGA